MNGKLRLSEADAVKLGILPAPTPADQQPQKKAKLDGNHLHRRAVEVLHLLRDLDIPEQRRVLRRAEKLLDR